MRLSICFLGQAALGHRVRVVLAHDAEPLVERFLAHLQHLHRDADVGEVHGDAAAHGARTDQCGRLDLARRRVLGHVRDLAHLPLGEEQMPQRLRLGGLHAAARTARARAATPLANGSVTAASTQSTIASGAGIAAILLGRSARARRRRTPPSAAPAWRSARWCGGSRAPRAPRGWRSSRPPATMSPFTISSITPSSSAFSVAIGSPLTIIVQRTLDADQPRQPLRAAGARQHAQLHFGQRRAACRRPRSGSGRPAPAPARRRVRSRGCAATIGLVTVSM